MTTECETLLRGFYRDGVPHYELGETPELYLKRVGVLGHGFSYGEIVKPLRFDLRRRFVDLGTGERAMTMAMTLAAANVFRERAMVEAGVKGLKIAAAYRPSGGANNSQHKFARALDLDRIGGSGTEYFRCAVRFWCEFGVPLFMGLGLYTWGKTSKGGIRVHLDTDYKCRSWQGVSVGLSAFAKPYRIADQRGIVHSFGLPVKLAVDMNLDVPSLEHL